MKKCAWSPEEDKAFRGLYPSASLDEIQVAIPGRSLAAMRIRASNLGIKRRRMGNGFSVEDGLLKHLSDAERGYVAGIFDGEGSVSIAVVTRKPQWRSHCWISLYVGSSDGNLIRWLQEKIPVGGVYFRPNQIAGRRNMGYWSLRTRAAIAFLSEALPHLIIKRTQAEVLIAAWERWDTLTDADRLQVKADLKVARIGCPQAIKHQ